jgi:hypothetical protein
MWWLFSISFVPFKSLDKRHLKNVFAKLMHKKTNI